MLGLWAGLSLATVAFAGDPGPQPLPGPSAQTTSPDGVTTFVVTPQGHFPSQDPFEHPPGSNFLMTIYSNLYDSNGDEMPNTLPSTPDGKYNLVDGPVSATAINPDSPQSDLRKIIEKLKITANKGEIDQELVQRGIDILEGNPIPGKAYSGFAMLHYNGPNKFKKVTPVYDSTGNVIGGNVDVNMIYFGQHIESDTSLLDNSAVHDVPWTVTYHVNILRRGAEDFSPMMMNFDVKPDGTPGPFHASMDQTFFPMLKEGTRYTLKIKETRGKYFNLVYTWGWRIHPPRVQVMENANKVAGGKTLLQWEQDTFGTDPMGSDANKLKAIAMIGDLSPAKRMWNIFRSLKARGESAHDGEDSARTPGSPRAKVRELYEAFLDWTDRTKLPTGVTADPNATITLFFVNNTIYGNRQGLTGVGSHLGSASYKGIANGRALGWHVRPYIYRATIYNGDHFPHGYMSVDFGGSRGWENEFQYSDPVTVIDPATGQPFQTKERGGYFPFPTYPNGNNLPAHIRNPDINADPQLGSGCYFTFGRNFAWPNAGGPWGGIIVPPVSADGTPGLHKVQITFNFEPSPRLRIYQFDPLHHDEAVYSLH